MDQQQEQPVLNQDYWNQPSFHEALTTVPFKQNGPDGARVVNVNDHFFKLDGGQLVMARVPKDLSLPTEWQATPESHPLRTKALSMIGVEAGQ